MSNLSKLSQGSAALSAVNRRVAQTRRINPILKPLNPQAGDINASKHSFSANNSVVSDQEAEDFTMDDLENLLTTTQTKMSELTKEFKAITGSLMPAQNIPFVSKPVVIQKPDSGKGVRTASNLDSLLSSTALNPIPRNQSKIGFSIKSGRQQRSLSKTKK
jgi:hypothetical protein